jgi:hypothetical protein
MNHYPCFVLKCDCGSIISQCRCLEGDDRPVTVHEGQCYDCKMVRRNAILADRKSFQDARRKRVTDGNA